MISKNLKKYIPLCMTLLFATGLQSQEVMSLKRCREMALAKSENLKMADKTLEKANAEKKAMRTLYLPSVSGSATGVYLKDNFEMEMYLPTVTPDLTTGELTPNIMINPGTGQPVIGADGNPVFNMYAWLPIDLSLKGAYMAGVSVEQPLFTGGKILAANKMAGIGIEMAHENRDLQQMNTLAEADQTYWLYVSVTEKVKLAKKSVELLNSLVERVQNSYETGMVNKNELLKIQVQYNKATLDFQKAQSGLQLTRMSLCRVTGLSFDTPIMATDTIVEFSNTLLSEFGSEDATLRPEYKLMEYSIALEEENIKITRAEYLPTAGLSAGYTHLGGIELSGTDYNNSNLNVMASVKIPLFQWGKGKQKIAVARIDKELKELELEKNIQLLQLEIEQSKLNLQDAWLRISITETSLKQAEENLRVSNDNYELGAELITDLLIAQAQWQNAFSELIDAKTDFKLKETLYLKTTAKLLLK
ncbi:MAG: TolC family protein [Marinilabiliaceae bacterium]|nr:TolC family protein [Marinilabiliaceae bacterium]